jgi:hypothetical protein
MTLSDLRSRTLERLGEDPAAPVYFTAAEATAALNRAQRLLVLLTLCLETTDTVALTANTTYYAPRSTFSDWLLPLRVNVNGASNPKVRPATLGELRALSATWEADVGAPTRYGQLGLDLLFIWKRPAASGTTLDITYAYQPANLVMADDTPQIPEEYHSLLIDYAVPWLRLKEGGQELDKAVRFHLPRFHQAAVKLGDYVRRRSLDLRYDTLPFELARFDASRLLSLRLPKPPAQRTLTKEVAAP